MGNTLPGDFWQSETVQEQVRQLLEDSPNGVHQTAVEKAWRRLQDHVVRHYPTKEDRSDPAVPSSYPAFRLGLFVLADLLFAYRQYLNARHGETSWERVMTFFQDDPKRRAVFRLIRQVSAMDKSDAVESLEEVGRTGVLYRLPTGSLSRYGSRDCGIELIVQVSRAIESRLDGVFKIDRKNADLTQHELHPNTRHRVTVHILERMVRLTFLGGTIELTGKQMQLFLLLYASTEVVSYPTLWNELYPDKMPLPRDASPPTSLRTLKRQTKDKLKTRLGQTPGGADWIEQLERLGYRLNRKAVNWQLASDSRKWFEERRRTRPLNYEPQARDSA